MNTTAHENETLELTLDELDAVNGGGWVEAISNVLHLLSGGGSSPPRNANSTNISNSGNGVGNTITVN